MENTNVAILISTMNRPEFMIRTLNYYAKMQSPHPVYIIDSSDPEKAKIITDTIEHLKNKLSVVYNWRPPGLDYTGKSLSMVREKYACVNGDDDYMVPGSLTKCAEFLEHNPDYASAGGYAVTFRLVETGAYGELKRLADYPRYDLEENTSSQRLIDFLKHYFTINFSVNRTDHLKTIWTEPSKLSSSMNELFPGSCSAIAGKSKLLDHLAFVRHIHDQQYQLVDMVDWLTAKEFHDSYTSFRDRLAQRLTEKDNIDKTRAERVVKDAFFEYLQMYINSERRGWGGPKMLVKNNKLSLKVLRSRVGKSLPILKKIYRTVRRSNKKRMHEEVVIPGSQYYKDFQPVFNSFTGKDLN